MTVMLQTVCPYCGSEKHRFSILFSFENGTGECRSCESCNRTWDEDNRPELEEIESEEEYHDQT